MEFFEFVLVGAGVVTVACVSYFLGWERSRKRKPKMPKDSIVLYWGEPGDMKITLGERSDIMGAAAAVLMAYVTLIQSECSDMPKDKVEILVTRMAHIAMLKLSKVEVSGPRKVNLDKS